MNALLGYFRVVPISVEFCLLFRCKRYLLLVVHATEHFLSVVGAGVAVGNSDIGKERGFLSLISDDLKVESREPGVVPKLSRAFLGSKASLNL